MMKILSWNIQSGLGCDGIRDLDRIAQYIKDQGFPELICLQEISRNIPEYSIEGQWDQLEYVKRLFPDYHYFWGPGCSWHGGQDGKAEFGNLTLSKGPVISSKVHLLPKPPAGGECQIVRVALETVIEQGASRFRLINTHLAYHVEGERRAQLDYLSQYQEWEAESCVRGIKDCGGAYSHFVLTPDAVLCGDFNMVPESDEYALFAEKGWRDSWREVYPGLPNSATCGIFENAAWPEGAHCRDYFWVNKGFRNRICDVHVDQDIDFSDHQPITLIIEAD